MRRRRPPEAPTEALLYVIVKLMLTAILVVLVSEIARRSTFAGALLASLPLVSLPAMVWLYVETGDVQRVSQLSTGIFWLVLPCWLVTFRHAGRLRLIPWRRCDTSDATMG